MEKNLKPKFLKAYKKVKILFKNKKYNKCYRIIKKIIPLLSSEEELFFAFIKQYGIILFYLRKYQEAIFYLDLALKKTNDKKNRYEIHNYLFQCYFKLSDYKNIIKYSLKIIEYEDISLLEKAKTLSIIGRFYYLLYLQSNLKVYLIRGLYYNTESQKIFTKLNVDKSKEYIYTLYDCADINFGLEDYDTAINYYEKIENITNNPDILFGVYTSLIYIYQEKGYIDTMLYYKRKLKTL